MKAQQKELFSEGSIVRILTFEVKIPQQENMVLGINIQKIKEILECKEAHIQPLSQNYYPLLGLINLRHLSIPLLDLGHFLGFKSDREALEDLQGRIIICEFQKLHLGILVDKTHKIRQFKNSLIQPMPEVLSTFPTNIFNGMLEENGSFINLLDIEFILTKLNVNIAPEKDVKTHGVSLAGESVLVVEDSKLFQKKLLSFFGSLDAEVILAEDGEEGLRKLQERGSVDLIFSDIEMPKLNGIGMVRKIKENPAWRNIPIIFNTSISNPGLIEDIQNENLGHYIVKFDEAEILRALGPHLKKK